MTEELIMKQLQFIRNATLYALDNTTEEMADIMPKGFRNTIRWQFGHILVSQEGLLFRLTNKPMAIPKSYITLFGMGSSPAGWTEEPPSLETLRADLQEQTSRIVETFSGKLSEKLPAPFNLRSKIEFQTVGEVLTFTLYHEGVHCGAINALKCAIEGARQQ